MNPRPVDLPMARAQAHLASARYPQAIGAFRAAVGIDPTTVGAHLGLASALAAQGRRCEAVEGLIEAAQAFTTREAHVDAMQLLVQGLVLDPSRTELHFELAVLEEALGQHEAAIERIEGLAERYVDEGRTEEAAELLRFVSTWDAPSEVVAEQPANTVLITGETVIALNPLLLARPEDARTRVDRVPSAPLELELDARTTVARAPVARAPVARDPDPDQVTRMHVRPSVRRSSPPPAPGAALRAVPAAAPGNPVVERLRARAGLHHADASPRRVDVRMTEPIAIRHARGMRPDREEDVTLRFRRPRSLDAAS